MKGARASRSTKPGPCVEMQPPGWAVLSLPTSPAGSRSSSWLVALCLQTDGNGQRRGEVENQRGGRGGNRMDGGCRKGRGGRKGVSLFSLSAVLKTTSPHNASAAADGPPLIQAHARTICTTGACHKVCVHALGPRHTHTHTHTHTAQSGELKMVIFIGFQFG